MTTPAAKRDRWEQEAQRLSRELTRDELAAVLCFNETCATCAGEGELHEAIRHLGALLEFEFILYAYMHSHYLSTGEVCMKNLSNPPEWMAEYDRRHYLQHDPVRVELEAQLAAKKTLGVFVWDHSERALSPEQQQVITARRSFGLHSGFSAFCDSARQDAVFLISFASGRTTAPSARAQLIGRLVVPHLNRCRKRLDLTDSVASLTKQEQVVAGWLLEGKSNGEIAEILGLSVATAKYHVANILTKLRANGRQSAVALLAAERYLA
jgi:DNA-binding CsgD family transcriptional regulator